MKSEEIEYCIDVKFKTRVKRSPRVLEIAEAFGIGLEEKDFIVFDKMKLSIKDGDIVYITGQSGGGKSVLLRELSRQMADRGQSVSNLDDIKFDPEKSLIDQIGKDSKDAIKLLGRAGINDAYMWIRKPGELSDGQRYRFRLAKAMESGADVWVADEFLAVLDRTSAKVIAFALQKVARQMGVTVLVATTHTDMTADLYPDLVIEKRFREKVRVEIFEEAKKTAAEKTISKDELYELFLAGI